MSVVEGAFRTSETSPHPSSELRKNRPVFHPYPEYKDSGVEWLGEVPAGWEVAQLRRYVVCHNQGYYSSEAYVDDGIKLLRITDFVGNGRVSFHDCPKVRNVSGLTNYFLKKGDFVFARTGGAGSFGYVDIDPINVVFAAYLIRFRFRNELISESFLKYFFIGVFTSLD